MISITDIKKKLTLDNDQKILDVVKDWPMLHFSDKADIIIQEGFRIGAPLRAINLTGYMDDQHAVHEKGVNFSFNVLGYCFERDESDFMAGINSNLMGMYSEKALLFLGSGVYTKHYDDFNQIIFNGDNVKKNTFILLENTGFAKDDDGDFICDDSGEEVEFWVAKNKKGDLITEKDTFTLEECIEKATHYLLSNYRAHDKAYQEFDLSFSNLDAPEKPSQVSTQKKKRLK